jgi:hypothetical protein
MLLSDCCHRSLSFLFSLLMFLRPYFLFHLEVLTRYLPLLNNFVPFLSGLSLLLQLLLLDALLTFQVGKAATSECFPNDPCSVHKQLVFLLLLPPFRER